MTIPEIRHPWRLGRFAAAAVLVLLRYSGVTFGDVPYWLLAAPAWGPHALAFAAVALGATGAAAAGCAAMLAGLADQFDGKDRLDMVEAARREARRRDREALRKANEWPPSDGPVG